MSFISILEEVCLRFFLHARLHVSGHVVESASMLDHCLPFLEGLRGLWGMNTRGLKSIMGFRNPGARASETLSLSDAR